MNTYRWLRNTHLFLGLFCCFSLLMFGVSSVQMSHNRWFSLRPEITVANATLPSGLAGARAAAQELLDHHGLRGELAQVRATTERISFQLNRPGFIYQVEYAPASGATAIRVNRAGFMGLMNRIHHVAGLNHEYWLLNAWGLFAGITSAALFFMGGTGVYLWFKIHKERLIGIILLAGSLAYSLTLIVLLRFA